LCNADPPIDVPFTSTLRTMDSIFQFMTTPDQNPAIAPALTVSWKRKFMRTSLPFE
jgi:hypothetical protein